MRIIVIILICLTTLLLPVSVSSAQAASYIDETVQGLQADNVYVSMQVRGHVSTAAEAELVNQTEGTRIAVVALPTEAARETGGTAQFVSEIVRRSDYDTVVIAFGDDLVAGSSQLPGGVAAKLADEMERSADTTGNALLGFVAEVRTIEPPPAAQPAEDGGFDLGLAVIGIIALAAIGAAISTWIARRRRPRGISGPHDRPELPQFTVEGELRKQLEQMQRHALQIQGDDELRDNALRAATETDELFVEIRRTMEDRVYEKTAEFTEHLKRVNRIFEKYLKARVKPRHFTDAQVVIAETRRAIIAYGEKVHLNLIGVNEGDMLEFEVDVAMLTKPQFRPRSSQ